MITRLTMMAVGVAGLVLSAPSARSAVIWTFFETSCITDVRANCAVPPPGALATLTLPDINSSGSWSFFYNMDTGMSTETGDTDFSFQLEQSGTLAAPHFRPDPGDKLQDIFYNIAFASSPSALAISVNFFGGENALCIQHGNIQAPGSCFFGRTLADIIAATDLILLGCSINSGICLISGNWVLEPVPEPSSLGILGISLMGVLIAIVRFANRRARCTRYPCPESLSPVQPHDAVFHSSS